MNARSPLPMYVIYENPRDFPGQFVVRRHDVYPGRVEVQKLATVHTTLEQARRAVPQGLVRLERSANDDPVIRETWL